MTSIDLRCAALALVLFLATACSSSNTPTAPAAESAPAEGDGLRRNPVVAGRPGRVFVMAGFGKQCESLPAPTIRVTQPPTKGDVSFQPGQETTINTSVSGTCIGQRVTGTGIYYTARASETGTDSFTVEAELGGALTQRTFTVEIVQ